MTDTLRLPVRAVRRGHVKKPTAVMRGLLRPAAKTIAASYVKAERKRAGLSLRLLGMRFQSALAELFWERRKRPWTYAAAAALICLAPLLLAFRPGRARLSRRLP